MANNRRSGAVGVRADFLSLLSDVKERIQTVQTRAMLAVNSELVRLYWDIGRIIDNRQRSEGWGAGVIPRLSKALKNELPELKGFSERNIKLMLAFHREYPDPNAIVQPAVAQLPGGLFWAVPWAHHVIIIQKVKDLSSRRRGGMKPAELRILLQAGESRTLEFKESLPASLARDLVAMANAKGGQILLGVRDDGSVVGVRDANALRARVQDIARNCDPPVAVKVEPVGAVLVVQVRESDAKPVQCSEGLLLAAGGGDAEAHARGDPRLLPRRGRDTLRHLALRALPVPSRFRPR